MSFFFFALQTVEKQREQQKQQQNSKKWSTSQRDKFLKLTDMVHCYTTILVTRHFLMLKTSEFPQLWFEVLISSRKKDKTLDT